MALTIETIRATQEDEAMVDLLSEELHRLLPDTVQQDRDLFHRALDSVARGLRAMAGIHEFDVSMTVDDLAWHFGNQNDDRDLRETLNGLRELELFQVADLFEQAWKIMEPHLDTLRQDEIKAEDFHEWLENIGAQKQIDPMNDTIWDFCKQAGDLGLLNSWVLYARKYPERCVVTGAQS